MKVTLPWPDSALLPNRRHGKHWTSTHKAKTAAREAAMAEAMVSVRRHGFIAPDGDLSVSIVLYPPDRRRRDIDGTLSSLKHCLDGIAQAIQVDDSRFNPITLERREVVKGGRVEIIFG